MRLQAPVLPSFSCLFSLAHVSTESNVVQGIHRTQQAEQVCYVNVSDPTIAWWQIPYQTHSVPLVAQELHCASPSPPFLKRRSGGGSPHYVVTFCPPPPLPPLS